MSIANLASFAVRAAYGGGTRDWRVHWTPAPVASGDRGEQPRASDRRKPSYEGDDDGQCGR